MSDCQISADSFSPSRLRELTSDLSIHDLERRAYNVARVHFDGSDPNDLEGQLAHMFKACVYRMTKPKVLTQNLVQNGFEAAKAAVLAKVWEEEAKSLVEKARSESLTLTSPISMGNHASPIDLDVTVRMSNFSIDAAPMTAIRFGNHVVEFDPQDLRELYDTLECIQASLDSLK